MAFEKKERTGGGDRGGRGGGDDLPPLAGGRRRGFGRKKVCRFLVEKDLKCDYKEPGVLKGFVTERAKIVPRRINGNTAVWQRRVALAIKRARILGFMPFTVGQD
jgi:small subunit ribosomal protein S18